MAIDMRPYMATDLAQLFVYDFPNVFTYLGTQYQGLFTDQEFTEMDEEGGPRTVNILEIHTPTTGLATIPDGATLNADGEDKLVVSSKVSRDGAELIITCRSMV